AGLGRSGRAGREGPADVGGGDRVGIAGRRAAGQTAARLGPPGPAAGRAMTTTEPTRPVDPALRRRSRSAVARSSSGDRSLAVADQAQALPGVGKARARMVGTTRAPALRVTLWLADDCNVATVLEALETQVLAPARAALGLAQLPVAVRLELDDPPPPPRVT